MAILPFDFILSIALERPSEPLDWNASSRAAWSSGVEYSIMCMSTLMTLPNCVEVPLAIAVIVSLFCAWADTENRARTEHAMPTAIILLKRFDLISLYLL